MFDYVKAGNAAQSPVGPPQPLADGGLDAKLSYTFLEIVNTDKGEKVGQIKIVQVTAPDKLLPQGNSVYATTSASGGGSRPSA